MAQIANRDLEGKVQHGQHDGKEDPPSCKASDEEGRSTTLIWSARIPVTQLQVQLTTMHRLANAAFPA